MLNIIRHISPKPSGSRKFTKHLYFRPSSGSAPSIRPVDESQKAPVRIVGLGMERIFLCIFLIRHKILSSNRIDMHQLQRHAIYGEASSSVSYHLPVLLSE